MRTSLCCTASRWNWNSKKSPSGQIFGAASPFAAILEALRMGRLEMAVSNPILLEFEEVILRPSGSSRWDEVWRFLTLIDALRGNIHHIGPSYRFHTIIGDPDDDAFADCAIAAEAAFVIASDHHFDALIGSGYRPQPIKRGEFIRRYLPTLLNE